MIQDVGMLVVHVDIAVHPDRISDFMTATVRNAAASLEEPGILRFDVASDRSDPSHVSLVEVYLDSDAVAAHKQTPHYAVWRDAVADMMARPRSSVIYSPIFPATQDEWGTGR